MAIEIVTFPIKNCDFPYVVMLVYQRVYPYCGRTPAPVENGVVLCHFLRNKNHPRWCRISQPSTVCLIFGWFMNGESMTKNLWQKSIDLDNMMNKWLKIWFKVSWIWDPWKEVQNLLGFHHEIKNTLLENKGVQLTIMSFMGKSGQVCWPSCLHFEWCSKPLWLMILWSYARYATQCCTFGDDL